MKALVVDDSIIMRERISNMLTRAGNVSSIVFADSAEDALSIIEKDQFDIITVDIKLPGKNGIELLKEFKNKSVTGEKIVISNYPYPEYIGASKENGANHFVCKFYDFDNLLSIIKNIKKASLDSDLNNV